MITFRILKRDGLVVRATFWANDGEDVPLMVMSGICPDVEPSKNDGTPAWLPTVLQEMATPFGNKIIGVIAPPQGRYGFTYLTASGRKISVTAASTKIKIDFRTAFALGSRDFAGQIFRHVMGTELGNLFDSHLPDGLSTGWILQDRLHVSTLQRPPLPKRVIWEAWICFSSKGD